jgi:hypothetical protein
MTLPERRTGMIDRDLATQPFWQLGNQPLRERIQRRDLFGAIAKAQGAPLGEPELDSLSWIIDEWHRLGSPVDGQIRFTLYAMGCDLYAGGRASWSPSGRHRELMKEAIEHLHQVVITLRSINVNDGDTERTLRSKVHILETLVDHEVVSSVREELDELENDEKDVRTRRGDRRANEAAALKQEQQREAAQAERAAAAAEIRKKHAPALGRLRTDSVEVTIAPWLVRQLLTGTVVLDWRTQRKLGGAAKRLWYQLSALAADFEPTAFPNVVALTFVLDEDFYAAMHLQAERERDNRSALAAAARRIVASDDAYRSIEVLRADSGGGYVLRAMRSLTAQPRVVGPDVVEQPPAREADGQLQLGA